MDDLRNIIIFSGCVDKALCGDVVKMTEKIEKLISCIEINARIDELKPYTDYIYTFSTAQGNAIERVKQLKEQLNKVKNNEKS